MKKPCWVTASEIRELVRRAFAELEAIDDQEERAGWRAPKAVRQRIAERVDAVSDALRFCASASVLVADPSLLHVLVPAVEWLADHRDYREPCVAVAAEAMRTALALGGRAELVEDLVEHRLPSIRRAVASGLSPDDPTGRKLLERLARDQDVEVRTPARAALSKVRDIPWWTGKWSRDPLEGLSPEEAEQHRSAIEAIVEILDRPRRGSLQRPEFDDELAAHVRTLPDGIAIDVAEMALSAFRANDTELPAVGAAMVEREGGTAALLRLCEKWEKLPHFYLGKSHVAMVASASTERRLSVCLSLAERAAELSRRSAAEENPVASLMASLAGDAFPADCDPEPLFLLGMSTPMRDKYGGVPYLLFKPIGESNAISPGFLERLFDAFVEGRTGHWQLTRGLIEQQIEKAPVSVRRALAERAIASSDETSVRWGISSVLLKVHDPERDPAPYELAGRFFDDPRTRRAVTKFAHQSYVMVPYLREALRRDALEFMEAATAIEAIGNLWGGVVMVFFGERPTPSQRMAALEKARSFCESCLGPEHLRGPVTDEEWAAFRRARARHPTWDEDAFDSALRSMPDGADWHPEDRALFERAMDAVATKGFAVASWLALVLRNKGSREHLPLLKRICAMSSKTKEHGSVEHLLSEVYEELEEPVPSSEEDEEEKSEEGGGGEWMDETE